MRSALPYVALVALVACLAPEEGVRYAEITGTVRVLATHAADKANDDDYTGAVAAPAMGYAPLLVDGDLDRWANAAAPNGDEDQDWYALDASVAYTPSIAIWWGSHVGEAEAPGVSSAGDTGDTGFDTASGDTGGGDTASGDTGDTGLPPVDADGRILVQLADLDDFVGPPNRQHPNVVAEATIAGGSGVLELPEGTMIGGGHHLALVVVGLQGEGKIPYRAVISGKPLAADQLKVGAYEPTDDLTQLGHPVAGASVPYVGWDGFDLVGGYDMIFVREVESSTDTDGVETTTFDESVSSVTLVAADWGNLDAGLRSGTLYSGTAATIDVGGGDNEAPELALDTVATARPGFTVAEVEPNDLGIAPDATLDLTTVGAAQAAGSLSGPGYIDTFTGACDIKSADGGYVHDNDAFSFTVPEPSLLFYSMSWDDPGADLDVYVYDPDGNIIDGAASADMPEQDGGYSVLEPDTTYLLVVLGYAGSPGTSPAYTLTVEQATP